MFQLQKDQVPRAAEVLARAFFDDPVFEHFFPDGRTRLAQSRWTFRFLLNQAVANGRAFCTSPLFEGVAAWIHSSKPKWGIIEEARRGGIPMLIHQQAGAIRRQMRESAYMKKVHLRMITGDHWYFSTIGIDPASRGRGHGDRLVRKMLEEVDGDRSACYLDTHKARNVAYYRRYGFEVVHRASPPESGVDHWAMFREPR